MFVLLYRPVYTVSVGGMNIELWVSQRRMPALLRADGLIVPVAPDLKMVFGVAKIARDFGADKVQNEANRVAPLAAGKAFVGTGSRYRYKYTALAVIFDEQKRTSPQLIASAVRRSLHLLQQKGAESVVFPDMTENLLTQPNWITPEQRRQTAELTARMMVDTLLVCRGMIPTVRIWVWNPDNGAIFKNELKKLEQDWESRAELVLDKETEMLDVAKSGEQDWLEIGGRVRVEAAELAYAIGDVLQVKGDALLYATSTSPGEKLVAAAQSEAPADSLATPLPTRLAKAGGSALIEEAKALGNIPLGGVALTRPGALSQYKRIIHLATHTSGVPALEASIIQSVNAAIAQAELAGFERLVVTNLGAGGGDYPPIMAASVTVNAFGQYLKQKKARTCLRSVVFVGSNAIERDAFDYALDFYQPGPLAPFLEIGKPAEH